jgi:hypothetical protein
MASAASRDVDDPGEFLQRVRAVLADGLFADGDAGAVDQALQAAEVLQRRLDRGLGVVLAGDVALDEARLLAELRGQGLALGLADVGDDGVAARGDDHFDGGGAEAGAAAGDDEGAVLEFHGS